MKRTEVSVYGNEIRARKERGRAQFLVATAGLFRVAAFSSQLEIC